MNSQSKQSAFVKKYGVWALVTGGSEGIGKEFAMHLADLGHNIIIVARTLEKLELVAQQIKSRNHCEVRIVCADLSRMEGVNILMESVQDLEIGILVNNVGVCFVGPFLTNSKEQIDKMLGLNINSLTYLTYELGKKMQECGKGAIILVSSSSGFHAIPYMGCYSATKAYILHLGEALYEELRGTGVDVLVLAPGPTKTPGLENTQGLNITKIFSKAWSCRDVVETAFKNLGKKPVVILGLENKILIFLRERIFGRRLWLKLTKINLKRGLIDNLKN